MPRGPQTSGRVRDLQALLRERDPAAWAWQVSHSVSVRAQRRLNHHGHHRFEDRSSGAEHVVVVLAGYKHHLWPYTLARLERFVPAGIDVCLVSPGVAPPELGTLAARAGWSWLSTSKNSHAMALNLAIDAHPRARYIHKLDEDILVGQGYFDRLSTGYRRVYEDGRYRPGFVAPLLNVNGFSYRLFLEAEGLEADYLDRFGELRQACEGVRAHSDGEAARWLWERSLPFDETVRRFAERPFGYSAVPHRFSIGALMMERDLWEAIGGFIAHARGGLGHDERHLCQECNDRSRVPVVLHDVFAGHFAFGPQDEAMRAALPALASGLEPASLSTAPTG
jgi:hypothetical protein